MSKHQLMIDAIAELLAGNDPKNPKYKTLQEAGDWLQGEAVVLYFSSLSEAEAADEFIVAISEAFGRRHITSIGDPLKLGNEISSDLYLYVEELIGEEVRQQVERLQRQAVTDVDTDSKIDHIKDTRSAA